MHLSLSSDISPEFREFERSSTTVLNALLMPVVGAYLSRLEARLATAGFNRPVYLVQSNGGVARPAVAAREPARLLLSGPSGGALAAETLAGHLNLDNLVAVDMGGTSYDVSLIDRRQPGGGRRRPRFNRPWHRRDAGDKQRRGRRRRRRNTTLADGAR